MGRNGTFSGGKVIEARAEHKNSDLSPRQEKAILALLTHQTLEEAAQASGISRTTMFRWLQDKDFHAGYMRARRESVRQAIGRLQSKTSEAVNVLVEIMNNSDTSPFARVGAAKAIIEYSIKAVEVEDLAQRVEELEASLK
jgi:hypothetical protein